MTILLYIKMDTDSKNENEWTDNLEIYFGKILQKAYAYSWIHTQSYLYYENIDYWISIFSAIITYGLGTGILSSITKNADCQDKVIPQIIFGAVAIMVGVIITARQYSNYPDKIEKHKNISTNWLLVQSKIEKQLILPRMKRENGSIFTSYLSESYDDLIRNRLKFPSHLNNKFKLKFKYHIDELDMIFNSKLELKRQETKIDLGTSSAVSTVKPTNGLRLQEEFEQRLKEATIKN